MADSNRAHQLREDALAIWQAGVDAVRSEVLVQRVVQMDGNELTIGDESFDLSGVGRVAIVGAGKAGAGMAAALEAMLAKCAAIATDSPQRTKDVDANEPRIFGWVNVPDDCVRRLNFVHLHGARPAGVNEPTEAGARGTREILRIVGSLSKDDLCFCLISGGASALMPAPVEGITLADKLAVTRLLSGGGANIAELNTVRKQLSLVKGGGLARACRAGRLITLIISDVLGDPLDVIGSGPTVPDSATPADALAVLERFAPGGKGVPPSVLEYLRQSAAQSTGIAASDGSGESPKDFKASTSAAVTTPFAAAQGRATQEPSCAVTNLVIGNNALAVDAAGMEAERRGYSHAMHAATTLEGAAEDIGRHLASMACSMRGQAGPDALITGGEPTVKLPPADQRGLGGRNQQLVLAALEALGDDPRGVVILSGGTDGEDGPTDAAGAFFDDRIAAAARERRLDPAASLARCDAYHFFEPIGGLIKTGPTNTNVCDLRVVLVERE